MKPATIRKLKKLIAPTCIAIITVYTTNTSLYNGIMEQYLDKQVFTAILPILTYATALWLKKSSSQS